MTLVKINFKSMFGTGQNGMMVGEEARRGGCRRVGRTPERGSCVSVMRRSVAAEEVAVGGVGFIGERRF